ncbi:MAG: ligase-associated DNA damage response DEXH box helicase [Myxococcota bacterium]
MGSQSIEPLERLRQWFTSRGWTPHPFQERAWRAQRFGRSGLIHVPTGSGKTLAAYAGALARILHEEAKPRGLKIIYLTPLRALTRDIEGALRAPIDDLDLPVTLESRTGDTSTYRKKKQRSAPPNVLVTTPESLSVWLSYADSAAAFQGVSVVLLDEWHELLSSKRGAQTQLCVARIKHLNPDAIVWAISATVSDLDAAAQAAVGHGVSPVIVRSDIARPVLLDMLTTGAFASYPWGGARARRIVEAVAKELPDDGSAMIFTNTRTTAEHWYQGLLDVDPSLAGRLGLHHGSIDQDQRSWVERSLKAGELKAVVATSSLDLGLDLGAVERVFQIGSPKSVALMVQRAGRASHRPGEPCKLTGVPTHPFHAVEFAAVKEAMGRGAIEAAPMPNKPLDVLAQHMVTCALGGGFSPDAFFEEITCAHAYRTLTREEFDSALKLVMHGGAVLEAYPDYRRVEFDDEGSARVPNKRVARRHRMTIGTIASSTSVRVKFLKGPGRPLGHIDERYVAGLKPGDQFVFAGRMLEFVQLREMTAYVKRSSATPRHTPRWSGGRRSLSAPLAGALRRVIDAWLTGEREREDVRMAGDVLSLQHRVSALPRSHELLVETCATREGHHLCLYPFAGRSVHEGLAALLALRLTRVQPASFALAASEYGLCLTCDQAYPYAEALEHTDAVFASEGVLEDLIEAINLGEMTRRAFRGVARVAGLVFTGYPGARKTSRQVQTSTGLLFDVFTKYDPRNPLLEQARREVLDAMLEHDRLERALESMRHAELLHAPLERPSPLGLPMILDRLTTQLSNESMLARIERMKRAWTEA